MSDGGEKRPGEIVAMRAEGHIMSDLHCIIFLWRRGWSRQQANGEDDKGDDDHDGDGDRDGDRSR